MRESTCQPSFGILPPPERVNNKMRAWELSKKEAIEYMNEIGLRYTSKNYRRKVLKHYRDNYKGVDRWVILGKYGVIRECLN